MTFEEQFVHLSQREVILVVEYQLNCLDSLHCQKTIGFDKNVIGFVNFFKSVF